MKVTVCFGTIRVVVPCGNGELLVRDLEREAIRRYKKASGKNPDSWVVVHHLQSQSGILDPDDRLNDVADDREQIIASYDDHPGPDPGVPQGGGDGASGSSVGTGSPDIFRNDTKYTNDNATHIEVTSIEQTPTGLGLQVRRGSEPSLHQLGVNDQRSPLYNISPNQVQDTKRWSAAPVCRSDTEPPERILSPTGTYLSPDWNVPEEESHDSIQNFSRSGRLSMQFLGNESANGFRWMDAAEKVQSNYNSFNSKSLPRESKRKEPLGQANASVYESIRDKEGEMLLVVNENGGPLGLSALTDSEKGGLLVQGVEPGSRADRGRLRRGDRILEINGIKLIGLSETSVQEHLKKSLTSSELRLRVIRGNKYRRENRVSQMIEAEEKPSTTKVATVSPTRKVPGAPAGTSLQTANTRKLGKRIEIALKKGVHGLGFSVTTRDNPAGGHCPIYIKNILPKGAAVEDGRLKPGDRLLEVEGIPMTGKSQTEVVGILRSTQSGATVNIVVSRQSDLADVEEREIGCGGIEIEQKNTPPKPPPPVLPKSAIKSPRNLTSAKSEGHLDQNEIVHKNSPSSQSTSSTIFPWKNREILTLHIPVHDTEKAGLGVSVKGKTGSNNSSTGSSNSSKHDGDLGIFVKSVLHGGAASRDGRLKMNDQLLSVNGISLLGQSNAEAMDTLRRAMLHTSGGTYPGKIILTVARRIGRPMSTGEMNLEVGENSNSSEQSGATVIYLSPTGKPELPVKQVEQEQNKRWSNPVLDRLTGGNNNGRPPPISQMSAHALRNESYYMATNDNWSPSVNMNGSNAVLIEEDPEPTSPTFQARPGEAVSASTPNGDTTYASQLSLETNPANDAFSRDAVGRRSMSEKHHAAMDARETGTYQRNKKLREEREKERKGNNSGSVESLANHGRMNSMKNKSDLNAEALDRVGELGPSLGMKKSSSLESLQTMVQEIQMSDEPRGPTALRTPRGRGREESLRAAVERPPETQARKHWLLEDGTTDIDAGFTVTRNSPFQSSLNDGKNKNRQKKPGLLRGIGHMFRFGKHRKDCIVPATEIVNDVKGWPQNQSTEFKSQTLQNKTSSSSSSNQNSVERSASSNIVGPPQYQPPPPPPHHNGAIHHNDVFNHRYSHYVNYEELQQQISRRHQHYHSQRSTRTPPSETVKSHQQQKMKHQRPISSFYEYETIQQNGGSQRKSPSKQQQHPLYATVSSATSSYQSGSIRSRGPFVTQVHIQNQIPFQ